VIKRDELQAYLQHSLAVDGLQDYCPNGLQVSGSQEIRHLVTGVTGNLALFERAVQLKAEAVLVHHGLFWRGDDPCVKGMLRARLAVLLAKNINLFAYHLPLDVHRPLGNNWQLADQLGCQVDGSLFSGAREHLVLHGRFSRALSPAKFGVRLAQVFGRSPLHLSGGKKLIHTFAWCTGAGHSFLQDAANFGVDAFLTGEVSERTTHQASELGVEVFVAGHHATERYGVQALGAHLAQRFGIKHTFVDVPNPI
jgi:dinuclear metal center YbgI/SA1388 family protein